MSRTPARPAKRTRAPSPAPVNAYRLAAHANYPLERSIAHKLRRASREVMRALELRLAQHGIPPGSWFFLRVLWDVGSIGQTELAARAGVMGPTTVTAMERMERLGLITRERSTHDKRRIDVNLTAKGRRLREQLMPEAVGIVNTAMTGLSDEDVDRLHALLDIVISNLANANDTFAPSQRGQRGSGA